MVPSDSFSKPHNMESRVDFPQPDGHTMATNSPSLIVRLRFLIAVISLVFV